ncbi:MAG: hypothetical protein GY771_16330 [bacterium]|nr:hypothetical protein [bacterium]
MLEWTAMKILDRFIKLALIIAFCLTIPFPAYAMGKAGAVSLEVVGGFGVGFGGLILGIPVGNLFNTDHYAGVGFMTAMMAGYPAGVALGVYGIGEWVDGDSVSDGKSLGVTMGASLATMGASYLIGRLKGMFYGFLLTPVVSTLAYNLVKETIPENDGTTDDSYSRIINFSINF